MKIDTKIRYQEEYLPTKRHRIPRIREVEEDIMVELREVSRKDAPVAMVVTDYRSYLDENGKDHFGLRDVSFYAVGGRLYSEKRDMWGALDKGPLLMKDFVREVERHGNCLYGWVGKSKEEVLQSLHKFIDSHVLIDGVIYREAGEPRYVVQTFGLGHNHGSTGLFVDMGYNPNISKDSYFSALQRDEAIAYANEVATRRGDTDSLGRFDTKNIKVYMPEMVRCNPQLEHGNGDPFLNSVEGLIQGSGSVMEAGLLAMAATQAEIEKPVSDVDSLIHNAEERSRETVCDISGRDDVEISK